MAVVRRWGKGSQTNRPGRPSKYVYLLRTWRGKKRRDKCTRRQVWGGGGVGIVEGGCSSAYILPSRCIRSKCKGRWHSVASSS